MKTKKKLKKELQNCTFISIALLFNFVFFPYHSQTYFVALKRKLLFIGSFPVSE